jgi:quinol monooxygenase YgiN
MIVYEVTLDVDPAIADDYRRWLAAHVAEMLALPGFVDARIFEVLQPAPPDGRVGFCVHYRLHDEAALDRYLAEHADAMREAGRQRFGERFSASRRVLRPVPTD